MMKRLADFDLSVYRDRYVKGRIYHLLKARQIPSIKAYISILHRNPLEIQKLKDLLTIHTTEFFRDITPFRFLEKTLLKKIAQGLNDVSIPIRILSAPCSTGQEVYSLAIIAYYLNKTGVIKNPIIIYGIDIDKESVTASREGIYRIDLIGNISFESMKLYFDTCADNRYLQVKQEIRNYCRFFVYDLFKPLPLTEKFDLILCRNLLIYVSQEDQAQLMTNLKAKTKRGGYMMLGNTEGITLMRENDFEIEDMEQRIYKFVGTQISRRTMEHKPDIARFIQPDSLGSPLSIAPTSKALDSFRDHEINDAHLIRSKAINNPPIIITEAKAIYETVPKAVPGTVSKLSLFCSKSSEEIPDDTTSETSILDKKPSQNVREIDDYDKDILKRVQQVMDERANERLLELEKIIQRTKLESNQTSVSVENNNEIEIRTKFRAVIERRAKDEESELIKIKKISKKVTSKNRKVEGTTVAPQTEELVERSRNNVVEIVEERLKHEYDELEKIVQDARRDRSNPGHTPILTENIGAKKAGTLDELVNDIYESAKKDVEDLEKTMEKRFEKMKDL